MTLSPSHELLPMIYRRRDTLQLEFGTRHRADMPDRFAPHLFLGIKDVFSVALNVTTGLSIYFGKEPHGIVYKLEYAKRLSFASTQSGFSLHLGPPVVRTID